MAMLNNQRVISIPFPGPSGTAPSGSVPLSRTPWLPAAARGVSTSFFKGTAMTCPATGYKSGVIKHGKLGIPWNSSINGFIY